MRTNASAKRQRASGLRWIATGLEAGLLFVLPLVFYRGFAEQFSTAKTLIAEALVTLGVAATAVALAGGKIRWPSGFRLALPLGALAAAVLVSCLRSSARYFSLIEAESFLCGPLWLLIWVTWNSGKADLRRAAKFITAAGGVAAAIALLQWAGHDPLLFGGYSVQWGAMVSRMRLYSTFGNPNLLSGYLIGAIFPALALALVSRRRIAKMAAWSCAAIMLAAIAGAGSYGGWAALMVGAIAVALVYRLAQSRPQKKSTAGRVKATKALAAVPVWFAALILQASVNPSFLSRLQGRMFLWRAAWPMFAAHPLVGSGWGTFQLRYLELQARFLAAHPDLTRFWTMALEAHNDPYQILLESGLLGVVALLWLGFEYGRDVRTAAGAALSRKSILWLGASVGGVVSIFVNSLVNFQLAVAPTLILLFTLLGIPRVLSAQEDGAPPRDQNRRSPLPAVNATFLLCGFLFWGAISRAVGELKYQRGLEFESQGDYSAAERADRDGISAAPWDGRLHFALARTLYRQGKYAEAFTETELAEPTFSDSHLEVLKARILDQMGRGPEALASYRRALYLDPTLKSVQAEIDRLEKTPQN